MRRKRGWGLLDGFILMLILLGFAGLALRVQTGYARDRDEMQTYTATVLARGIHVLSVECIREGETLYLTDGTAYGTVESVSTAPAEISLTDEDGVKKGRWDAEQYCDLTVVISLRGSVGENAFLIDGRRAVLLGERLTLRGERSAFSFVVTALEKE